MKGIYSQENAFDVAFGLGVATIIASAISVVMFLLTYTIFSDVVRSVLVAVNDELTAQKLFAKVPFDIVASSIASLLRSSFNIHRRRSFLSFGTVISFAVLVPPGFKEIENGAFPCSEHCEKFMGTGSFNVLAVDYDLMFGGGVGFIIFAVGCGMLALTTVLDVVVKVKGWGK